MTTAKTWSYRAGEKGRNRCRVYEKSPGGPLFLEWWEEGARKRKALAHCDRKRAKRQADRFAATVEDVERPAPRGPTVRSLFEIYLREVTPRKSSQTQTHERAAARMFCGLFGNRLAADLSRLDWDRFVRDRSSGRIRPVRRGRVGKRRPVRANAVREDLAVLKAVLSWSVAARLIDRNPIQGFPMPSEKNPRRVTLAHSEYLALLHVAERMNPLFRRMLILANETGHRINSVRLLRWEDVDLDQQRVTWRAEADKMRREHVTPLSEAAVLELAQGGEGWVFPAARNPEQPVSRYTCNTWLKRALKRVGIQRRGLGWHALRRKFATELKDAPLRDLAELGGWKDTATILKCYQQPEFSRMREALANRRNGHPERTPEAIPA